MTHGGRLLFVHAHPDDESSKGAATAAYYVDAGARVTLVTCTGGEAGEVLNPSCPPVEPAAMAATRRRELEAACEVIGFHARYQLGFLDSGYHEDPAGVPEGAFARQPVDVPALGLAAIVRAERPHVVVTYPEDGGYPHPDHIMCHEVTLRAVDLAETADPDDDTTAPVRAGDTAAPVRAGDTAAPVRAGDTAAPVRAGDAPPWRVPKVYACHAFPPERVLRLHEALQERGLDSPFEGWMERRAQHAEWPCDAVLRVDRWFDRRDEALRRHVTQIDPDGLWFGWPRDLERELYPWECFTRLRSDPPVPDHEDDLFTGLDLGGGDT